MTDVKSARQKETIKIYLANQHLTRKEIADLLGITTGALNARIAYLRVRGWLSGEEIEATREHKRGVATNELKEEVPRAMVIDTTKRAT
ncbi:MAG: MarR family transcriptional regulator, partial [Streptococcaceae bacterium]|nr:MarR family transcriptional regulator [Streptococcaceae bacterium]